MNETRYKNHLIRKTTNMGKDQYAVFAPAIGGGRKWLGKSDSEQGAKAMVVGGSSGAQFSVPDHPGYENP